MGKRAKIIAEIERQIARLEDRPGLCLYYAHHTAAVLWRHNLPGGDSGRFASMAACPP